MNKKRLVSMLIVSAMKAALFTGCGSDGNLTSGDGTINTETAGNPDFSGLPAFFVTNLLLVQCSI